MIKILDYLKINHQICYTCVNDEFLNIVWIKKKKDIAAKKKDIAAK